MAEKQHEKENLLFIRKIRRSGTQKVPEEQLSTNSASVQKKLQSRGRKHWSLALMAGP